MPGKGKMTTTGKLGEVMQESIQAALSGSARVPKRWGLRGFLPENDIHIHLPEGDAQRMARVPVLPSALPWCRY